jgi:hypothetical protein
LESASQQFKADYWKDFHPKNLLIALQYASQFMYIDTDLTTDYCGTLHIPNLETTIREQGGDCVLHSCGKNMVRQAAVSTRVGLETYVILKSQAKFYNKIFETLSSASARSKEIGHKLHYILNPSTPSLKETFRAFHAEGVSRFETTHSNLMSECAPDLESMLAAHEMLAYPLSSEWNKTLVVSSLHDHISQMESAADCSVATFFPHMTCLKASSLKAGAVTTKTANKEPEGCVAHYYNRLSYTSIRVIAFLKLDHENDPLKKVFRQLAQETSSPSESPISPPYSFICLGRHAPQQAHHGQIVEGTRNVAISFRVKLFCFGAPCDRYYSAVQVRNGFPGWPQARELEFLVIRPGRLFRNCAFRLFPPCARNALSRLQKIVHCDCGVSDRQIINTTRSKSRKEMLATRFGATTIA